jgi:methionyl-tRNA synthetase
MSDGAKFYTTTAIDYPNNAPHIGTAFEKIGADVQARFRRLRGRRVHFLMGNDEHAAKVDDRAKELGKPTQQYVDEMAEVFQNVWKMLEISNDDFIQTSEPRHKSGCQRFLQQVYDAGDIYKAAYEALYCEGCEDYKTARDLVDGKCPNHPNRELKHLKEENYFFALSKYQDRLLALYRENPDFIRPEIRRNEVVSLVESGLKDQSISRPGLEWGIEVPFDPEHKIYVWFDALLNYITAIGYGSDEDTFGRWWPADIHFIGKDITRFHCALWPAMLMSARIDLPRQVFAHGFVYHKGAKMSKTLGNIVDPLELCRRYGADAFRYYFMRECPFGGDGDFTYERFIALYNSDLANNLGNLFSRTVNMCQRYFDGVLPQSAALESAEVFAGVDLPEVLQQYHGHMQRCEYNQALALVWQQVLDTANRYVEQRKPFELAKTDRDACKLVLANLAEGLRVAAVLIAPFMPSVAARIYGGFNFPVPFADIRLDHVTDHSAPRDDIRVTAELGPGGKVAALFPRIQAESEPRA